MRFQAKLVFSTDGETEKAASEVESADLNLLYKISGKNKSNICDHIIKVKNLIETFVLKYQKKF